MILAQFIPLQPQIRQLAAVELRKRVGDNAGELWIQVSQEERNQIKSQLPEIVLNEPSYVA